MNQVGKVAHRDPSTRRYRYVPAFRGARGIPHRWYSGVGEEQKNLAAPCRTP